MLALEIFERAITGKDIATGTVTPAASYLTEGTKLSEYREGSSTIQFDILPTNATYNTTTNAPNIAGAEMSLELKRDLKNNPFGRLSHRGKKFKP